MRVLSSLSRAQKEAVGLLQIGTFLEYFDLMLYVHMAVVLNDLFFPKTDAHTAALLSAFAFCSTYMLRPIGALIFGYIGDTFGRKLTVILTTMMMSMSCVIMANLPTYAEIGIVAAWLVTGCRIVQGLSSMGEIMGAEIYVTEITKPPAQYPAVAFIGIASYAGTVIALAIASLVTHFTFNWRIAFWMGAGIAVVGSLARTRLRETPEFLQKKHQKKHDKILEIFKDEKMERKSFWAYFVVYCGWPLSFYLAYMYFNPILKEQFSYTSGEIILHNFILSIVALVSIVYLGILSYRIHPLKILEIRGKLFIGLILLIPFVITHATHFVQIFLLQVGIITITLSPIPAVSVFIKYIPVLRRFTAASFVYALTRAVMYVVTSFSLVYLTEFFGYYGLWIIMFPVAFGFLWGVKHFEKLEGFLAQGSSASDSQMTLPIDLSAKSQ